MNYIVPPGKTNPTTEVLTLLVTDANGISAVASKTVSVTNASFAGFENGKGMENIGGVNDVGTEWVGTSMGLGGSAANAGGFVSRFRSSGGSVIRFNWGDFNAWERDFKDPAFGGTDTSWADNVDALFYTGHAGDNGWSFPGHFDDDSLNYWEARYGNNDLEWITIAACGPLQNGSAPHTLVATLRPSKVCTCSAVTRP